MHVHTTIAKAVFGTFGNELREGKKKKTEEKKV